MPSSKPRPVPSQPIRPVANQAQSPARFESQREIDARAIREKGWTDERIAQAKGSVGFMATDPTTGLNDSSMGRADQAEGARLIQAAKNDGTNGVIAEIDFPNIGGMNTEFGESGANAVIGQMVMTINKHLGNLRGADPEMFVNGWRRSNGRIRFHIKSARVTSGDVSRALSAAQTEITNILQSMDVKSVQGKGRVKASETANPKLAPGFRFTEKDGTERIPLLSRGTGVIFSVNDVANFNTLNDVNTAIDNDIKAKTYAATGKTVAEKVKEDMNGNAELAALGTADSRERILRAFAGDVGGIQPPSVPGDRRQTPQGAPAVAERIRDVERFLGSEGWSDQEVKDLVDLGAISINNAWNVIEGRNKKLPELYFKAVQRNLKPGKTGSMIVMDSRGIGSMNVWMGEDFTNKFWTMVFAELKAALGDTTSISRVGGDENVAIGAIDAAKATLTLENYRKRLAEFATEYGLDKLVNIKAAEKPWTFGPGIYFTVVRITPNNDFKTELKAALDQIEINKVQDERAARDQP